MRQIRPLKNGGFSMCSCSDENVGKGRCQHVLGFASIVINDNDIDFMDMKGAPINKNNAAELVDKIGNSISQEKKEKILDFFKQLDN